jgi:hypothetical protein
MGCLAKGQNQKGTAESRIDVHNFEFIGKELNSLSIFWRCATTAAVFAYCVERCSRRGTGCDDVFFIR